jgi:hypothetical protein
MPLGTPVTTPASRAASVSAPKQTLGGPNSGSKGASGPGKGGYPTGIPATRPASPNPTGASAPDAMQPQSIDPYVQWAQGQQQIIGAQQSNYNSGLDLQGAQAYGNYGQNVGQLQANQGFDLRYLGNDQTRLNADQALWAAKNTSIGAQWDLAQRRFNDQAAQNQDRWKLAGQTFDNNATGIKSRYQSAMEAAGLSYDRTNRQVLSDNTARGATLTQGFRDTNSETQRGYDYSKGDATRTRDVSLTGNQIGYDATQSDLRASDAANRRTSDADAAATNLAGQQQLREKDYMDALGNDYGVKGDQINDALKRGISKLNMDYAGTVAQLANLRAQGSAQALAQASALEYQLLNASLGVSSANSLAAGTRYSGHTGNGIAAGETNGQTTSGNRK